MLVPVCTANACMLLQVPMRGSKPHVSQSFKQINAASTTSAAGGAVDASPVSKPATSKLRHLAAQQLAILRATARAQCAFWRAPWLVASSHVHSAQGTAHSRRAQRQPTLALRGNP